jgi:predicted transposase/invertase (TIGR01784 family)
MFEAMLERVGRFEETAINKGVEKGRQQEKLENARGLKEKGVPDTVIAEALKLPPEVVARL